MIGAAAEASGDLRLDASMRSLNQDDEANHQTTNVHQDKLGTPQRNQIPQVQMYADRPEVRNDEDDDDKL